MTTTLETTPAESAIPPVPSEPAAAPDTPSMQARAVMKAFADWLLQHCAFWYWMTPSPLRSMLFRARFGLPWKNEYYQPEPPVGVNYKDIAYDFVLSIKATSLLECVSCLRDQIARNDPDFFTQLFGSGAAPSSRVAATPAPPRGAVISIPVTCTEVIRGTARFSATNSRTGTVRVPENVIREAIEANDATIVHDWVNENIGLLDCTDVQDSYDYQYRDHEETDGDGCEADSEFTDEVHAALLRYAQAHQLTYERPE